MLSSFPWIKVVSSSFFEFNNCLILVRFLSKLFFKKSYGHCILGSFNLLWYVLHDTAAPASLGPPKEGRYLLPGTSAWPADLLIPRWCGGKDGALDMTVTSPLAKSNVVGAAGKAGAALDKAFNRKVQGAAEACRQQGIMFIPVAAETLGGFMRWLSTRSSS